jgi:uncharacterized hydrophobic protein (TIGR00271 family)
MKQFLEKILDLKATSDFEKARTSISEGVTIRGYNLWILLCAALLASLGLDTNSTAVIIGAMLISPLMSPILGVGLSVAIHDKRLLLRSLRNLSLAVGISLFASVLYFVLTPLGEVTSELQARTFPTLLDVLVALFGGIAGIISISRHDQTNAIPGVAIATALMPPLCTAGFGLATLHWNYFLGAFYLFFINAVFISLATYVISKYLHFPAKEFVNKAVERKYSLWFTIISIVVLAPSVYFLYSVYEKELIRKEISELVIKPITSQGNEILKWDVEGTDSAMYIKVFHTGKQLKNSVITSIDSALKKNNLPHYHLKSMRVNMTKDEVNALSAELIKNMFLQSELDKMKESADTVVTDTLSYRQIVPEVKLAFPFIDTAYNGWSTIPDSSGRIDTLPVFVYKPNRRVSSSQMRKLYQYLLMRFSKDSVVLIKR